MTAGDVPKSLSSPETRASRVAALWQPHVAPLTAFVDRLRTQMGSSYEIPYFDPLDGGVHAECLFLLEAPGSNAVASGFISRNNPDETAKNFFQLNQDAGIQRTATVTWNIVPWYVGSGTKIRPVSRADIATAMPSLQELLALLPRLRVVVLVGRKAALAKKQIGDLVPSCNLFEIPHPSPLFVNRLPGNRDVLLSALSLVSKHLSPANRQT